MTLVVSSRRLLLRAFPRLPALVRKAVVYRTTPRYTVGVLVLLTRPDGRVLLVQQSYRRQWFLPGGLVKAHESVEEAARRELREELGWVLEAPLEDVRACQNSEHHWVTWHASGPVDDTTADALRATGPEIDALWWCAPDDVPAESLSARPALGLL